MPFSLSHALVHRRPVSQVVAKNRALKSKVYKTNYIKLQVATIKKHCNKWGTQEKGLKNKILQKLG